MIKVMVSLHIGNTIVNVKHHLDGETAQTYVVLMYSFSYHTAMLYSKMLRKEVKSK